MSRKNIYLDVPLSFSFGGESCSNCRYSWEPEECSFCIGCMGTHNGKTAYSKWVQAEKPRKYVF